MASSAIFISHSSDDRAEAQAMARWLKEEGHEGYFLDFDPERGLTAGNKWEDELYRTLRLCRAVLAVVTGNWLRSKWCFAEVALARAEGKPVFFVKAASCDTSSVFSDTQAVDITVDPDSGYRLLARSLKETGIDPEEAFGYDTSRPVYPGLTSYVEDDAGIFFGRSQEIQAGLEQLEILRKRGDPKLLLLLGASGSGKSSLMRAGLLPRLRRKPRSQYWLPVAATEPGSDPFQALAERLARAFENYTGKAEERATILARLRPDPFDAVEAGRALIMVARDLRFAAKLDEATVLIAIDQAEQLLSRKTSHEFVRCLHHALKNAGPELMVIATMRSDFLGRFQTHPELQELSFQSLMLSAIQPRLLSEVIEGPAQLAGIRFEPGLISMLVHDARTGDALPLLAFTLQRLYALREQRGDRDRPLSVEDYLRHIGGLERSVGIVADNALNTAKPSDDQLAALRKAFVPGLVDITEDGAYTAIRRPWKRLPEEAKGVLEEFVGARLLVSDEMDGERVVRIAHDALIRNWPFLEAQVTAEGRFLEARRRLERAALQWWETDKDDSRLLRSGRALAEGEEILAAHQLDLSDRLIEFIRHSQARTKDELMEAKLQRDTAQANYLISAAQLQAAANPTLALRLAEAALQLRESEYARNIAMQIYSERLFSRTVATSSEWIRAIAFTTDGRMLVTGSDDGVVNLWDLEGRHIRTLWRSGDPIHAVAAYPSGELLAIASGRLVDVIDYSGRRLFVLAGHEDAVTCVTISHDSRMLLTGSTDHSARLWEHGGKPLTVFTLEGQSSVWSVDFSPNGQYVLLGDTVQVFLKNLAGENAATFPLFDEFFVRALWAPDSRAVLCSDGRLFSLSDGSAIKLEGLNIESIAFSPRGDVIGAGGRDGAAMFWDRSGKKLCSLSTGENTWISRLAFSPDGRCAATVQGKSVGLWELWVTPVRIFGESQGADVFKKKAASGGDLIEKLDATRQVSVHGIHVSPTANTIVAGVGPNGVLWDPGGERMHVLEGHSGVIWTTAFSPDGERIVTGSEDNSARIWNKDGIFQSALTHEAAVITAAFSRGSSMVATGSRDGNVRLWKAESGELIREIAGDGNAVAAVAFFDQRPALLVSTELEARIVNLDGDVLQKVDYGRGMDNAILSADDRTLTTRSWKDHLISRVDLQSGNVTTFKNAGWAVDQIAVSPDERIIAASDINGLIRFWDSAGGELRSIQRGFRAYSLAFSRDGNSVLVGLETGVIEMWPCPKTLDVFLDGGFANPLSDADRAAYNIPKHQGSTTSAAASGGI